MRTLIITVAVFTAALVPFSIARAAGDLESRLNRLDVEVGRQADIIQEQQKIIESLKAESARQKSHEPQQQAREGTAPAVVAAGPEGRSRAGSPLRLMDISMDALFAAGSSTEDDEALQTLQGGGHDPRKRGFTVQNIELSLMGAVDPYLTGEAHLIFFLDPLSGETEVELEEIFLTTQSLPHGLQLEAGHFFTEFGRLNPRHPHQWHWQDQPVINTRLFGPDGMRGPGFRLGWLTPLPWFSEVHLGAQNANGETMASFLASDELFEERPIGGRPFVDRGARTLKDLVYLARLDNSWDLTDEVTALTGAFAVMVALHSGVGQVIDVNLLESLFQLMGPLPSAHAINSAKDRSRKRAQALRPPVRSDATPDVAQMGNTWLPELVALVDRLDDVMAARETSVRILEGEGLEARAVLVGDVMVDSFLWASERCDEALPRVAADHPGYVLLTMHRGDNVDDPDRLAAWLDAMRMERPVVFPVHPRTAVALDGIRASVPPNVHLIEPVTYLPMVALERAASLIVTDSGGVQREAYLAGVRCLTLRDETEWMETVQQRWNVLAGAASCGARPVSMSVFIRARSASMLLFGSTPNTVATPCPNHPAGGLYAIRMWTRVRPSGSGSKVRP